MTRPPLALHSILDPQTCRSRQDLRQQARFAQHKCSATNTGIGKFCGKRASTCSNASTQGRRPDDDHLAREHICTACAGITWRAAHARVVSAFVSRDQQLTILVQYAPNHFGMLFGPLRPLLEPFRRARIVACA